MAEVFWTPRRRKCCMISLAVVTCVLIVLAFTINSILAPIIGRKIKNAIEQGSNGNYQVSFSQIKLNIFTGRAELRNLRLIPNSVRLGTATQIYSGSAKLLIITGAHPLAYLFHKRIEIDSIRLNDPMLCYTLSKAKEHALKNNQTLYQSISHSLASIKVGAIYLTQAQLTYIDQRSAQPTAFHLKDLTFNATGLLIDSATQKDTTRTLYCQDITTVIHNFSGFTDNGLYQYRLKAAYFSTRSGKVVLRGMEVKPLAPTPFFAKTKADRFSFKLDSLVLSQVNYRSFLSDHFLIVKKLSAYQGSLGIFSNPNRTLQRSDRVISFPNAIIRTLQTRFTVDTTDITGFTVSYSSFNTQPAKTGTVEFNDTKARFLNITNQQDKLMLNPLCTVQLSTLFMGQGKLDLSFAFNLADKVYGYSYRGSLGPMPLTAINPILMPLALLKIKAGHLTSLDFSMIGSQHRSNGTLRLLYHGLDFDLLNRDYHNKVVQTLLAKTLVIKHNNPDPGEVSPRFAKVVFIRPKNYAFFQTLWQTLLNGIKTCAGVGYSVKPEPDKPLSNQEQKAQAKALKKAIKAKKKADKQYQKALKQQAAKTK